jgi:hypothetical protein
LRAETQGGEHGNAGPRITPTAASRSRGSGSSTPGSSSPRSACRSSHSATDSGSEQMTRNARRTRHCGSVHQTRSPRLSSVRGSAYGKCATLLTVPDSSTSTSPSVSRSPRTERALWAAIRICPLAANRRCPLTTTSSRSVLTRTTRQPCCALHDRHLPTRRVAASASCGEIRRKSPSQPDRKA